MDGVESQASSVSCWPFQSTPRLAFSIDQFRSISFRINSNQFDSVRVDWITFASIQFLPSTPNHTEKHLSALDKGPVRIETHFLDIHILVVLVSKLLVSDLAHKLSPISFVCKKNPTF